jgi:arsenate reductase (thioredoxin)
MSHNVINVLFVCTHNSLRSILAEAVLNHIGRGKFKAYSAGSSPSYNQQPDPLGLQALKNSGIAIDGLRSKLWDVFGRMDAPRMDLVITVCDNVADELGPYWPGQPATAHWGFLGPCVGDGTNAEGVRQTLSALESRLEMLISLPSVRLEKTALQGHARELADAHACQLSA